MPDQVLAFVTAWLAFVMGRQSELTVLFKRAEQRTPTERERIHRGLAREIGIEGLLFVPCAASLWVLALELGPWLHEFDVRTKYAIVGVVSYVVPFLSMKRIVLAFALRELKRYASVLAESKLEESAELTPAERQPSTAAPDQDSRKHMATGARRHGSSKT